MTELEFKNTNPTSYAEGNVNLLYSSSIGTGSYELPANHYGQSGSFNYDLEEFNPNYGINRDAREKTYYLTDAKFPPYRLLGLAIPFNSANDVALEQTLAQITEVKFTIGGSPVTTKVIQLAKQQGYFFIRLQPKDVFSFPTDIDNSGTPIDSTVEFIFNPYLAEKFDNSDFNALIGNASSNVQSTVAMQVDRSTDQLIPPNLDAITSKTATRASIQYSNYTVSGWTNARYHGSSLNSGSVFGDDPAMSFKTFKGSLFPLDAADSTITSSDDITEATIFFNIDRAPSDYMSHQEIIASDRSFPRASGSGFIGNLLYEQQGGNLVRIVNKKILGLDNETIYTTNDLGRIVSEV